MTKYILALILGFSAITSVFAQAPYINSISPTIGRVGQEINIAGNNLAGATVYFGGMEATSVDLANAASGLITATVPYGATSDQISVRTTNGIGYSPEKFHLTYDGQTINSGSNVLNKLSDQEVFPALNVQTQDLCLCDFDRDDDLDVAVSNAGESNILIYENTSTIGDANFTSSTLGNSFPVTNVVCGDLDGDGWPDLMANELNGSGKIYTYRNDQAGGFDSKEEWSLPTNSEGQFRKPGRIAIADLDLDGKPELVINVEDENLVYYFINTSTSGNVNFNTTPASLSATESAGSAGLGGLDIADLNNDGFPEIISSNFTESGFYVFQNNSEPGSFNFKTPLFTDTNSNVRALQAGDLDQDGFMEVVLTNSDITSSDIIEISKNLTSSVGSDVSMKAPIQITGLNTTWGLDIGDIDGDGDLDIAVASFGSNNGFYAVINTNSSSIATGSYSVGLVSGSGANNSRNIKIADVDSDGRPDFVYTNRSTAEGNGNLATRLNENCFKPVIRPSGATILCSGQSVDLIAPTSGYSYEWKVDGGTTGGSTNTLAGINTAGSYTVTILDNVGCQQASAAIVVETPTDGYTQPTIVVDDNTPCFDDVITFTTTPGGATSAYLWTGPNGYSSTEQNPSITINSTAQSGEYFVTATSSAAGCEFVSAVELVTVITVPIVTVNNPDADSFCTGSNLTLTTNDFGGGYTYDWKLNDASTGQTDPASFTASAAGDYSVTVTETSSGSSCTYTSATRALSTVAPPTSAFSISDAVICQDVDLTFTASSTGDASLTIINEWDFKDGSTTETGNLVTHSYTTVGTYEPAVTAKYDGVDNCTYTPVSSSVEIQAGPTDIDLIISDNTDTNNFEKCKESALRIRVNDDFTSYKWIINSDTVGTNAVLDVSTESSVTVKLVNDIKCEFVTDPVSISNYTTGGIFISAASPNTVSIDDNLGKIVNMEDGQSSVTLSVDALEPAWEPALYIDDTTQTTVVATVLNKQLITVYGIDNLGCQEKDSVTLVIPGVRADKSFTPNGDGIGDCWEVSNVGGTDCKVVIFDSKGRRIRDISFSPDGGADDCVWDGTKSGGSALPDGMYYYFISCSDSANESSGSIFMAR